MTVSVLGSGYLYGDTNISPGSSQRGATLLVVQGILNSTKTLATPTDTPGHTYTQIYNTNNGSSTLKVGAWYAIQNQLLDGASGHTVSLTGDTTNPVFWAMFRVNISYTRAIAIATRGSTNFVTFDAPATGNWKSTIDNSISFAMVNMSTQTISEGSSLPWALSPSTQVTAPGRNDRLIYNYVGTGISLGSSYTRTLNFSSNYTDAIVVDITFYTERRPDIRNKNIARRKIQSIKRSGTY